MKNKPVTVQGFTAADYANLLTDLATENFSVVPTSVDSFTATLHGAAVTLKGVYNRNQQTLTVDSEHSVWHPGMDEEFVRKHIVRVTKKEDATDEVQSTPVQSPRDIHGNLILPPKEVTPKAPTPPISTNVEPDCPPEVSTVPVTPSPASQDAPKPTVVAPPTVKPTPAS